MPKIARRRSVRLSTVAAMLVIAAGTAITHPAAAAEHTAPDASPPEYHPSMGDLMTMAVQPRHIKLGLAGQDDNWNYAAYELNELRNAFARIARTIPQYRNTDTTALVTAMTQAPLDAVEAAIKAKDHGQFTRTFAALTAACNACHMAQDHAMVIIQTPKSAVFPDQNFQPPQRK